MVRGGSSARVGRFPHRRSRQAGRAARICGV